MSITRIIKNISALALGEVITRILSLFFIIYLARYLGEIGFGRYSFAFAFTSLFLVIVDPGVNTLVIRDVAREKALAGKYVGNIILLRPILSVLAFALIAVVINLMDYPAETRLAVYIVGIYSIMISFSQLTRSVFRAFEKMEYEALLNISERLIFVSLGITVLFLGYGLIEVVSVFLIAGTANVFLSFSLIVRKFTSVKLEMDWNFWKYLIREGLPFGMALIFITVYIKIDTVMLSIIKGDAAAGWYNAAYQIPFAVSLISFAYMESIFPLLSKFYRSSKDSLIFIYTKSYKYLLIISLPIAVFTTLFAEKIIFLLYGAEFGPSAISLRILIWFTVFEFLGYLFYTVLASIDRQNINTFNTAVCAVANVLLNLLLIPSLSYAGASIAKVLTYIIYFSLNLYMVSRYLHSTDRLPLKDLIKPVISSISMGIILYMFKDLSLLLLIPLAALVYCIFLYLVDALPKEEIELWKNLFQRTGQQ